MKKNNRKGFTIVELVIVIAVIAILATVLVPTFGGIIEKANKSKTLQEVKNAYSDYSLEYADQAGYTGDVVIEVDGKYYTVTDGKVDDAVISAATDTYTGDYWDASAKDLVEAAAPAVTTTAPTT